MYAVYLDKYNLAPLHSRVTPALTPLPTKENSEGEFQCHGAVSLIASIINPHDVERQRVKPLAHLFFASCAVAEEEEEEEEDLTVDPLQLCGSPPLHGARGTPPSCSAFLTSSPAWSISCSVYSAVIQQRLTASNSIAVHLSISKWSPSNMSILRQAFYDSLRLFQLL